MAVGKRSSERAILTRMNRMRFTLSPFWSEYSLQAQVGVGPLTIALPGVIITDIPFGATVEIAKVNPKCRVIRNTNAALNKLLGATVAGTSQVIQVQNSVGGTWTDCGNFIDDMFEIPAGANVKEGGDLCGGQPNVSGEIVGNGTYDFRWLLSRADLDFLEFKDLQVQVIICYSI